MNPDEHTISEQMIPVGHGHELYVQEWGNPKAKTAIFSIHGGPGDQAKDRHRDVFDPRQHRVIFYDQRGCGKSTPLGSLEHNTMQDLVSDISAIADHFGLKTFVLNGMSWGTTVALAYAIAHPQRIAAVVCDGIWTCSQFELDWLEKGQFRIFYPEVWEQYVARTPKQHQHNPTPHHYQNILQGDAHQIFSSAFAVEEMEHSIMNLDDRTSPLDPATFDPAGSRIFAHFLSHKCFLPERHILDNARKLTMPVWLVQGRYDMACPPITAYELSQTAPNCHLLFTTSNHRKEHESWNLVRTILLQFGGEASAS